MANIRTAALILFYAVCTRVCAEDIRWGEAVGGLRVGIECATPKTTADRQPLFTVKLENVGAADLTIPAPSSYVPKTHEHKRREVVHWLGLYNKEAIPARHK
jgi:hypothetical protein